MPLAELGTDAGGAVSGVVVDINADLAFPLCLDDTWRGGWAPWTSNN